MRGRTYQQIVADKGYFGPSPTYPPDPPYCPCEDGEPCESHPAACTLCGTLRAAELYEVDLDGRREALCLTCLVENCDPEGME